MSSPTQCLVFFLYFYVLSFTFASLCFYVCVYHLFPALVSSSCVLVLMFVFEYFLFYFGMSHPLSFGFNFASHVSLPAVSHLLITCCIYTVFCRNIIIVFPCCVPSCPCSVLRVSRLFCSARPALVCSVAFSKKSWVF